MKNRGIKVGIITDGRVIGQMKKIDVLALNNNVEYIVTADKLNGEQFRKPKDISFRIMQNSWRIPFEQMVYVGNNLAKDFIASKQLVMMSVWFYNVDGLYKVAIAGIDGCYRISKISEIYKLLNL